MLQKTCRDSKVPLLRVVAEDRINSLALTPVQQEIVRVAEERRRQRVETMLEKNVLPQEVELAEGAKVVITDNIATCYHIVNGAQGVVTKVVLHPEYHHLNIVDGVGVLRHLPLYVIVRFNEVCKEFKKVPMSPGLGLQEVPIFPAKRHMKIQEPVGPNHPPAGQTVIWKQIRLTAAYGLTDYCLQG